LWESFFRFFSFPLSIEIFFEQFIVDVLPGEIMIHAELVYSLLKGSAFLDFVVHVMIEHLLEVPFHVSLEHDLILR
jgi:hypothetical protein